jgi:hypothetical protein
VGILHRRLDNDAALDHIGTLIDASLDAGFGRGADRALYLLDELAKRDLIPRQGALIEYFRANAWNVKKEVAGDRGSWRGNIQNANNRSSRCRGPWYIPDSSSLISFAAARS